MFPWIHLNNVFFKNKDVVFVAHAVPYLKPMNIQEGCFVYKKDDFSGNLFFLSKGRVSHIVDEHQIIIQTYINGSYFGEQELLADLKRTISTIAVINTDLLLLSKQNFAELMNEFPDYAKEAYEVAQNRAYRVQMIMKNIKVALKLKSIKQPNRPRLAQIADVEGRIRANEFLQRRLIENSPFNFNIGTATEPQFVKKSSFKKTEESTEIKLSNHSDLMRITKRISRRRKYRFGKSRAEAEKAEKILGS